MQSMNISKSEFTIQTRKPMGTYRIVNSHDRVIDDLIGLTLPQAENALMRCLNHGCNAFIQDENVFVSEYLAKQMTRDEVFELIQIGFSRPLLYKRAVWVKAKKFMDDIVCPLGYAMPHDFGSAGGKYTTNYAIDDVKEAIANWIAID
jgi:hypothetical protein